ICTNEALMALAATVYMIALGKNGMTQVAQSSVRNTQYAISKIKSIGATAKFGEKVFGEFVVTLPKNATEVRDKMISKGFLAGLPLGSYYEGMENDLLVAVTEIRTREQIDAFASAMKEVLA
ncbi:MAG: glycine dehydrogenase, partial [Armatimonadota bacterium]